MQRESHAMWKRGANLLEMLIEVALDLAFDRRLEHAEQEAEFGCDMDVVRGHADPAVDSGAAEIQRVAGPRAFDVELFAHGRRGVVDGCFRALERMRVFAVDIDARHERLP